MCVKESDVKKIADEAIGWIKDGIRPSASAGSFHYLIDFFFWKSLNFLLFVLVSTYVRKTVQTNPNVKMSKNKKKKLKKKEKLNQLKLINVSNNLYLNNF